MTTTNYLSSPDRDQTLNQTAVLKSSTKFTFKDSKSINFLRDLYSYPPKIKLSIEPLNEFNHFETPQPNSKKRFSYLNTKSLKRRKNLFTNRENYKTSYKKNKLVSNIEKSKVVFPTPKIQNLKQSALNKTSTTNFYNKFTNEIKHSLQHIPVFIIVNGKNEIVLAKKKVFNSIKTNSLYNSFSKDAAVSKEENIPENFSNLGLFFMNRKDADAYLTNILHYKSKKYKSLGFSIHCIGLDSAYEITRNCHSEIDFRFIPSLKEISYILGNNHINKKLIFDESQHQIKIPSSTFHKISNSLTQFLTHKKLTSFSKYTKREHFKGVPIYVVQLKTNKWPTTSLFMRINRRVDLAYANLMKGLGFLLGTNGTGLMTGSLEKNISSTNQVQTYIFFNSRQATQFCQDHDEHIGRYNGSIFNGLFGSLVKNPQIYVTNLEDFLEKWEEDVLGKYTKYSKNNLYFVPTKTSLEIINQEKPKSKNENYQTESYSEKVRNRFKKLKISKNFLSELFFLS